MNKKKFLIILFLGLIIRLSIAYFQYSGDVWNHLVWGNSFLQSPLGFFSRHFSGFNDPNYPPLAIIFFGLASLLHSFFLSLATALNSTLRIFPSFLVPLLQTANMQILFLKLPGIVSDIGITYLLYLIAKKKNYSSWLPLLYLFNPAIIYTSTVWGQIEPVVNFFLLHSIYLALFGKQKTLSPLSFVLAVLTKQTALWFLPFFLILWWKELSLKKTLKGLVEQALLFFTFYLPFGLFPLDAIKSYFLTLTGSSTLVSDAAWNIWYFIFPGRVEDSVLIGPISVRFLSIMMLLAALTLFIYRLFYKYSQNSFFLYLFLWSLLAFFIQTRVHERHLSHALLFMLLVPGVTGKTLLGFLALSLFHYFNLYQSLRLPFI